MQFNVIIYFRVQLLTQNGHLNASFTSTFSKLVLFLVLHKRAQTIFVFFTKGILMYSDIA